MKKITEMSKIHSNSGVSKIENKGRKIFENIITKFFQNYKVQVPDANKVLTIKDSSTD